MNIWETSIITQLCIPFSCIADQEMMMHLYDLIDVDVIC